MSRYLTLLTAAWGEDSEPTTAPTPEAEGAPAILKVSLPVSPAPVRRCFFCGACLLAEPDSAGPLGAMRRCRRCGGQDYETPAWVAEVTSRALEANRRRPVPPELSKRFSTAVLAGNETEAREVLAEIEAAEGGKR